MAPDKLERQIVEICLLTPTTTTAEGQASLILDIYMFIFSPSRYDSCIQWRAVEGVHGCRAGALNVQEAYSGKA